ncbi:hypothetical protein [Tannockella kyphosi]|uniref:hypothetical protein n=1 Tax=Tannockella kyphosi TaxID=2899121 RepID=UPI0020135DC0|nr:hypothetical protein [Tannockella kyphosi]
MVHIHRRDLTVFYVCRNGIATFMITLVSFLFTIADYYHQDIIYAFQRIFMNNLYSFLFFGLVWLLNYLLFELYKTGLELLEFFIKNKIIISCITLFDIIALMIPCFVILSFVLVGHDSVLELNGVFLGLFMFARALRQVVKAYKKEQS